jgi:hypothetical protein
VSYPPVKSGHLLIDGATLASVISKKLSAFSAMQNVDDVFDRRYACGDSDAVSALAHSETFSRLSIFALLLLSARARIVAAIYSRSSCCASARCSCLFARSAGLLAATEVAANADAIDGRGGRAH